MAAEGDYIMIKKQPYCKQVALPPKTATKRADMR